MYCRSTYQQLKLECPIALRDPSRIAFLWHLQPLIVCTRLTDRAGLIDIVVKNARKRAELRRSVASKKTDAARDELVAISGRQGASSKYLPCAICYSTG